ncbi:MAG: hypothetical protein HKN87_20930 [Saprospiraceae bacterium]|nr:hypothetical protein [Saprospiraceae bacterium]
MRSKYHWRWGSLVLFLGLLTVNLAAQDDIWKTKLQDFKIKASVGVQLWSTYTIGQEVFNGTNAGYEKVDNRLGFQFRRSRFGISGQPYTNFKFSITAALDFVGRDVMDATEAGFNNGASPIFRVWNAYVQWRIKNNSEAFNLTFGYIPAQVGRESITAALRTPSMEKAWSQNYIRRHMIGRGPGRTSGINLGGLFYQENSNLHWGYDLGIFNPAFLENGGNSVGRKFSPLVAGRVAIYFGDPESTTYTLGHKVNYFGKRRGLTLAVEGSTQGATNLFTKNQTAGFDFLLNVGSFNFDGEWIYLFRSIETNFSNSGGGNVSSNTGYLRMTYNLNIGKKYILEPALLYMWFKGETNLDDQIRAGFAGTPSGQEGKVNIGMNLYLNPDLKLSLHYTTRDADLGEMEPGSEINNSFSQAEVGGIRRGDWLGFGVVAIF